LSDVVASYTNLQALRDDAALASLKGLVAVCDHFARAMPRTEAARETGLRTILRMAGTEVREGRLRPAPPTAETARVIRLYKARVGPGRLKFQLFPLAEGESHPPHAHHDLVSCQILLAGRALIHEYSLLRRIADDRLEIREQPVRRLAAGDGVYTLLRKNAIHWQQGLSDGTLLLNINWQGFFETPGASDPSSLFGRRHLDWDSLSPSREPGNYVVRLAEAPDQHRGRPSAD